MSLPRTSRDYNVLRVIKRLRESATAEEALQARITLEPALRATKEYKALRSIAEDYCRATAACEDALEQSSGRDPAKLRDIADYTLEMVNKRNALIEKARATPEFEALYAHGAVYAEAVLDEA